KNLRNHLQHFDPSSFCYSFEDAAVWLNDVPSVARLNWGIRKCMGSTLSVPLIELLLWPRVTFVPKDPDRKRKPQDETVGYASVTEKPSLAIQVATQNLPTGSSTQPLFDLSSPRDLMACAEGNFTELLAGPDTRRLLNCI